MNQRVRTGRVASGYGEGCRSTGTWVLGLVELTLVRVHGWIMRAVRGDMHKSGRMREVGRETGWPDVS